jgi:protein involved in polysaccharide export with SLBB domain
MIMRHPASYIPTLLALVLSLGLAACGSMGGGSPSPSSGQTVIPAAGSGPVGSNDLLRVGDSITVQLSGVPADDAFIQQMKVDESGAISLPYIGSIPVAGQTSVQVKDRAEALYKMGRYFTTPNITVTSQQLRYISVSGEVRSPQRIYHQRELTAMGAIATCGGFTEYANRRKIRLLRNNQVIEFNASEVLQDPKKDISLLPDDIIQVDRSVF